MNSPLKFQVQLTDEQRTELERLARDGKTPSRKARYARLLLHADNAHPEGCRSDAWIGAALGMHLNTVGRIRKQFATGGLDAAFTRKPRETPPVPPKIDGRIQAHLASICCSDPPQGRSRWTLTLLANELKSRGLVTEVSIEAPAQRQWAERGGDRTVDPGAAMPGPADRLGRGAGFGVRTLGAGP